MTRTTSDHPDHPDHLAMMILTDIFEAMKRKVSWHNEPVSVPGVAPKYWDSETAFQIYVATWLRKQGVRFHHSANERLGARSGLMARLKGQSKGMPDLLVFSTPMVAIELKVEARVSPEQTAWLKDLASLGWLTGVCRCFDEVTALIDVSKCLRDR